MTSEDTREKPYQDPVLDQLAAETELSRIDAVAGDGLPLKPVPVSRHRPLLLQRWAAFWAVLWAAATLYGSAIADSTSFHFVSLPSSEAWRLFLQIPYVAEGPAQELALLESLALFVPLGFMVAGSLWPTRPTLWRLAVGGLSLFVCIAFALGIKYIQLYFPPHSVTLNVAFAQMMGALLGVALYPIANHAYGSTQGPLGAASFRAQWETTRRFGRFLGTPLSRCVALALTVLIGWLVTGLPVARDYVGAALLVCFVVQLRYPSAWLFFVPALLPVFDLTLWSGRIYFDEFDLLVLTTVAAHFWQSPAGHRVPNLLRWPGPVIGVFVLWLIVSAAIGFDTLSHLPAGDWGAYYSTANALRVAKASIWGLLLLAPLQWRLSDNPERTKLLFIVGVSAGLIAVGVATVWERGVFAGLANVPTVGFWASRYALAGALLDFTDNYRAMALFSELHTGGEAIDTYISLAPAIAAAGVLAFRAPIARMFCLTALGFGTYAAVVTFSRGSYAGLAAAMVVVFAMAIGGRGSSRDVRSTAILSVAAGLVAIVALFNVFRFGGYDGIVAGFSISAVTIGSVHFVGQRSRFAAAVVSAAIAIISTFAFAHLFSAARYNTLDLSEVLQWGAICGCALVGGFALIGYRTIERKFWPTTWSAFLTFSVICGIAIPSVGGTRMQDRLGDVSGDAQTRADHWFESLRLMEGDWKHYVFGMGLGTFPRLYYLYANSPETKSSYRVGGDGTRDWLELGTASFNMTQKIPLQPHTHYQLTFSMRSTAVNGSITVNVCRKYMIISERGTTDCIRFDVAAESPGRWVQKSFSFDSGHLGTNVPAGWPTTFMITNGGIRPPVQITDISLSDGHRDIIANGDFTHGIDRWILLSDFEHLAWHIKDVYLEMFFEAGVIGLALYLFALSVAFARAFVSARRKDPIGLATMGALAGFSVVGLVGSLFDNPRPALLFFIILFWTLSSERLPAKDAGRAISPGQRPREQPRPLSLSGGHA